MCPVAIGNKSNRIKKPFKKKKKNMSNRNLNFMLNFVKSNYFGVIKKKKNYFGIHGSPILKPIRVQPSW